MIGNMSVPGHATCLGNLRLAADTNVSECLDALEAAECTQDQFVGEMLRRQHEDPDAAREILATLDLHFRCQKIGHGDFNILKTRLRENFVPYHSELHPGDRLCDRYLVVDILRRTKAGTSVEALDEAKVKLPAARKRVAIQVVDENLAQEPEFLTRIDKLQNLWHPAIARLFEVEKSDGALLLVMELLNGASLHSLLARNEGNMLQVAIAEPALRAVAQALSHAHSLGIAHGNVNARNIFLTQAGEFRLGGFETHDPRVPADSATDRAAFSALARKLLIGPQQSRHAPMGISADLWRALRNKGDVFAIFAGSPPEKPFRTPSRAAHGWGIAASIAAAVGVGATLYTGGARDPAAPAHSIESAVAATPIPSASPVGDEPAAAAQSDTSALTTPPGAASTASAEAITPAPVRPRIDLPTKADLVDTTAPVARIWVRRRGNLEGTVSFTWWTESGSAEEDRDFRAVTPRTATIPDGAKGVELLVPLMPDPQRREPRTFYVKIDNPRPRAILGGTSLMQIAILPPGYPAQRPNAT